MQYFGKFTYIIKFLEILLLNDKSFLIIVYQLPRISKQLKETFVEILFFQFLLSLVVICFSIIKLSKAKAFDSTSMIIYPYLSAMLFQLFAYCWYGNLLMLNVSLINNMIYIT